MNDLLTGYKNQRSQFFCLRTLFHSLLLDWFCFVLVIFFLSDNCMIVFILSNKQICKWDCYFGLLQQSTIDWVAYKQHIYFWQFWSLEVPRSGCQHGWDLVRPSARLQILVCILTWQREQRGSKWSYDSYKGINPIHGDSTPMHSSNSHNFPQALSSNGITLEGRVSTY